VLFSIIFHGVALGNRHQAESVNLSTDLWIAQVEKSGIAAGLKSQMTPPLTSSADYSTMTSNNGDFSTRTLF
jgi:hypothetical protein